LAVATDSSVNLVTLSPYSDGEAWMLHFAAQGITQRGGDHVLSSPPCDAAAEARVSGPMTFGGKDASNHAAEAQHRSLSHSHRIDVLAERIALHIESLVRQGRVRCLDVGCGDLTLAVGVHQLSSRTYWRCFDVHGGPTYVGVE
jgi:hypothetical protein